MSGMIRTMVSPSISSRTRSTPCVEGCCGPMFRIMVRSWPGSRTGVGARWAIASLAVALHRIVFAQRMTFPILGHQEPPHIRMSRKANAEQIKDLALKVVGARPHRGQRLHRRTRALQPNFKTHPLLLRDRKQVVDHFKSRLRRVPIDAGHVRKEVERAFSVVTQQGTGLANVRAINVDCHLLAV